MTEEIITLSHTEIDRISVIRSIITGFCSCKTGIPYILYISRQLTQAQAAQQLNLSIRQVKRLTRAYRTCGVAGIASLFQYEMSLNEEAIPI